MANTSRRAPDYQQCQDQEFQTAQANNQVVSSPDLRLRMQGLVKSGVKQIFQYVSMSFSYSCEHMLTLRTARPLPSYRQHANQ